MSSNVYSSIAKLAKKEYKNLASSSIEQRQVRLPKILVVDDDVEERVRLAREFSTQGVTVLLATTAGEAMVLLEINPDFSTIVLGLREGDRLAVQMREAGFNGLLIGLAALRKTSKRMYLAGCDLVHPKHLRMSLQELEIDAAARRLLVKDRRLDDSVFTPPGAIGVRY